ncbi:MAG: c-type cytochrome [Anaerolineaceae bacterium]|nr:c-type cytochrome [Anaerolineaceae bacterium]
MKKVLKWIGWIAAGIVGLLIVALGGIYVASSMRLNKTYDVQPAAVTIPTGEAAVAEGGRQFLTRGCIDCHGDNGAGKAVIDDALVGHIMASNLTSGQGGVGQTYMDIDWVRAIRHAIGPDGKPLVVMPSIEYNAINDDDLGALIAYLKTLPPVDQTPPPVSVGPLGRILLVGQIAPVLSAEQIDHNAPRPAAVAKGPTAEYGHYLAQTCIGCHGEGLSGGPIPGLPPDPPAPQNLTPDHETGLGDWTEADFKQVLRQGQRPDGTTVNPVKMPWPAFQHMTDDEISALWLYLQSVPAKPFGER